jgi:hypothetical protein
MLNCRYAKSDLYSNLGRKIMDITEPDVLMFKDIELMLHDLLFFKNNEQPVDLARVEDIESSIGWLQEVIKEGERLL